MDTTETYVKMCAKAKEIQKVRPQKYSPLSDLFWSRYRSIICTVCEGEDSDQHPIWNSNSQYCSRCGSKLTETFEWKIAAGTYGPLTSTENHIWLPRQDQLQEMVEDKTRPAWALGEWFGEWCQSLRRTIPNAFASMEQLWLAFVMKEKFRKTWNGEDWE